MNYKRGVWLLVIGLLVGLGINVAYIHGQGAGGNIGVTADNGSLRVYGYVASGATGPVTPLANLGLQATNGALDITIVGGTVTPDNLCMSGTTQDSYFAEVGANNPGAYTGGTACAGGTLRFDWTSARFNIANALAIGTSSATAGDIRLTKTATINFRNNANSADFAGLALTADTLNIGDAQNPAIVNSATFTVTPAVTLTSSIGTYKNVTTAGWGVPAVYANGNVAAAVNVGTASIATYTVGAADGTFEIGCNILVTVSTTHSFSCDVTYTDEGNTARTMVIPVEQLAGTFATSGLITNATGAGPYESAVMTIRAKASTAITVRTSAGGTFTTVTYNARGVIKQVG